MGSTGNSGNTGVTARAGNKYRAALSGLTGTFWIVGLFSAAINILMLTGSVYMLQVYDRVLGSRSLATLAGLFTIVVVLYAFLGFYEFLRARIMSRASLTLDLALGTEAFRVWLSSSGGRDPAADLTQSDEPMRDLGIVRGFMASPAALGLFDVPWIPLYFAILFLIHPWLGFLTLAGAAIVAMAAVAGRMMTKRALGLSMAQDSAERQFGEAARRSGEVVDALGMQGRLANLWRQMHVAALASGQSAGDVSEVVSAFSKSFRMLLQSATLSVGALLVIEQKMTGGMIVASSIIAGRALAPIDQMIGHWRSIGRALVAHRSLMGYFDRVPPDKPRIALPPPTGQITVTRLTKLVPGTTAQQDRPRILTQVSFQLAPGDGLGVIGNSASGKSTLARRLVGAWRADGGEIRLDGATPDQWDPEALGRAIGYLPQHVEMLPGTIRDNIARFDAAVPDQMVIEAAKLAGVHDMVLKLPAGYATRLGGAEQILSGGQIQRLGLARALFGMPKLLVLDEPNSNLDVSGDNALAQAIMAMREQGSTVIVMAHRPSAIAAVNKVLILHGGTVAAFGRKEEVLAAAVQSAEPGPGGSQTANLFAALAAAPTPPAPAAKPPAPSVFRPVVAPVSNILAGAMAEGAPVPATLAAKKDR